MDAGSPQTGASAPFRGSTMKTAALIAASALALAIAFGAGAKNSDAARRNTEVSMVVRGHARLNPDGDIQSIAIEREQKVPAPVVALIRDSVTQWRIEPTQQDGEATTGPLKLTARVVGRMQDDRNVALKLKSVHFGEDRTDVAPKPGTMRKPSYPAALAGTNAAGTAYVLARLNANGEVDEAMVEQVNLNVVASEKRMQEIRDAFAASAVGAIKKWKFIVSEQYRAADASPVTVRIPVGYETPQLRLPGYGQWEAYLPGPRARAPWLSQDARSADADVVADGDFQVVGKEPRLLSARSGE
ncbi:hypothetical protein [Pseudomonas sp. CGJS7]|uniref:hypothetical protein n=1 Tax=Pseudomonas sp. CGJS7 TaxID=3109348 RepID=UPI00300B31AF